LGVPQVRLWCMNLGFALSLGNTELAHYPQGLFEQSIPGSCARITPLCILQFPQ